jgi:hypothetical protein
MSAAVAAGRAVPLPAEDVLPRISRAEAEAIGLVDEQAVDWNGQVDVDLSADEAPVAEVDIAIDGLPAPEAPEPTAGATLADHVQVGIAYQMHHEGAWHKVKLAHVNPARSFFIFTRGSKHARTISLTHRMLLRMCEAGRLKAYEKAYLLERATARARRQLAKLAKGDPGAGNSGFGASRPFLPSQPPQTLPA